MNEGAARVLSALRAPGEEARSGAALSRELGVSRAQIWKHVEALRERGYRIEGEPGGGYRLLETPDRLYPEEIEPRLRTRWLARRLLWFESVDSTNRLAVDLARQGTPHGTAVVAEGQTAGRGRLGRSFFSPPTRNLYTSLVLRPLFSTAEAPASILTAAVAVADAVAAEVGSAEPVDIKWPNDVRLGGRKVSGILMEMGAEASRVSFLVLGIGVNLNVDPASFPAEFREQATSVRAETGHPVDRVGFTARLYEGLETLLDRHAEGGFESLRERFETYFRMVGQRVRVIDVGGGESAGCVLGIDADGALRLREDDGETRRVVSGDVTLAKDGGAS